MFKHRRSLLGQYFVPSNISGWYSPVSLSIDFPTNIENIFSNPSNYSTFIHECLHYWQAISTVYGFYYSEVSSIVVHRFKEFLNYAKENKIKIKCPINKWSKIEKDDSINLELNFILSIIDFVLSHLKYLEGGLFHNGDIYDKVFKRNEKKCIGAWKFVLSSMQAGMHLPSYNNFNKDHRLIFKEGDNAPIVALNNGYKYALGALPLAEGFALACQFLAMIQDRVDSQCLASLDAMFHNVDYRITNELLKESYGNTPFMSEASWHALPLLTDLSFMGPFLPELRDIFIKKKKLNADNEYLDWCDMHPGYRFLKILDAISKSGIMAEKKQRPAQDFIRDICQFLSWPTPIEVAQEVLDKVKLKNKIDPQSLELIESYEHEVISWDLYEVRLKLLLESCKYRIEDPDIISSPNSPKAINKLFEWFKPIIVRTHNPNKSIRSFEKERKYSIAANYWDVSYSIAIGFIYDVDLLKSIIEENDGIKAIKEFFGINPEFVEFI